MSLPLSRIRPFLAAVLMLAMASLAPLARAAERFDVSFDPADWAKETSDFADAAAGWKAGGPADGPFLQNESRGVTELARDLKSPVADTPFTLVVGYGYRFGVEAAAVEVDLVDPTGGGLRLKVRQGGGEDKYQLFAVHGDRAIEPLGTLASDAADPGVARGGGVEAGVVALRYDPRDGTAVVSRLGPAGEVQAQKTFETNVKQPVARVVVRDASAAKEELRITTLRGFAGEADPSLSAGPVALPFGGSFGEGEAIKMGVPVAWVDAGTRRVVVDGGLYPATAGPGAAAVAKFHDERDAKNGDVVPLDPAEFVGLAPGLYDVRGTVTAGSAETDITGRLAIFNKLLLDRPRKDIPPWVGVVPLINVLPESTYDPAFEFMAKMGVRHVRWLPGWGRIEPEEGKYDWAESDHFISLCKQHDIGAMFCLSYYGAPWTGPASKGQQARSPQGRALWVSDFAVPTIQRYGDFVKVWQIWNEPDAFWDENPKKARGFAGAFATPKNYYDLLVRTHEAAHKLGIAGLKICGSLASGEQQKNVALLFSYGLADHFDGFIIHTYGNHLRHFQERRKQFADLGFPDAALGSGETGIPTGANLNAEMRQSEKVARVYLGSACIESPLLAVEWFTLTDRVAGGQFGLLDRYMQPQPAVLAYFTVAHLLAGANKPGTVTRRGDVEMYRIERDGRPPLTGFFGGGATSRLSLAVTGDAPVAWDLLGRATTLAVKDGLAELPLGDEPKLVEGDVRPMLDVTAAVAPTFDADGRPQLRVTFDSGLGEAKEAEVSVDSAGLKLKETRKLTIKPGETDVTFDLPERPAAAELFKVEAVARWSGGGAAAEQDVEFTPIPKLTAAQADSPRRPANLPFVTLDKKEQMTSFGGRGWAGPQDLSATVAFGYTNDSLIVWVDRRDDKTMPINRVNPWGFDGAQLDISPSGERTPSAAYTSVNFGPTGENQAEAFVLEQPHLDPQIFSQTDGDVTHLRLTLSLSQFGIEPALGKTVALSLILNDNDGDGRAGWMSFGGGIAEEKNPARYRQLIFAPAPEPAN